MIFALMSLLASAGSVSQPSFPAFARASWADSLSGCEPEFTQGFKIKVRDLSFYDGPARLLSLSPVAKVRTPSGQGQTFVARIRYKENDNPVVIASERFTVAGKWLYHSDAKDTMAKHLSSKNRSVRCPAGSTDG